MKQTQNNNNNQQSSNGSKSVMISPSAFNNQPSSQSAGVSHEQQKPSARLEALYQVINPKIKYHQSQRKQLSRFIDNYVSDLQPNPWLANGITPHYKYTYNDSGLGFQLNDKYQVKLNETQDKIRHLRGKQDQRTFQEFTQSKPSNLCVLIEFCSDCQSHESTTKHDEKKYVNMANSLKSAILRQFPIAKITLKPVRIDPFGSSLGKLANRQKIGAFEVFVKKGEKDSDKQVVQCLFSKMKLGRWPEEQAILTQLRDYMDTFRLVVTLTLNGFDQQNVLESDLNDKIMNKLYDIPIQLVPDTQRTGQNSQPSDNNKRLNTSVNDRPASGISRKALSKSSSQQKIRQGQEEEQQPQKPSILTAKTDIHGRAIFEGVPLDHYNLRIQETNDYMGLIEKVNMFALQGQNNWFDLQFTLACSNLTFLTIIGSMNTHNDQASQPLTNALIKITAVNNPQERHPEEDEDPIAESFNSKLSITLIPHEYIIQLEKDGCKTIELQYTSLPGQQILTLPTMTKFISDQKSSQDTKVSFISRPISSGKKGILKNQQEQNSNQPQIPPSQQQQQVQQQPYQLSPQQHQPQSQQAPPQKQRPQSGMQRPISAQKNQITASPGNFQNNQAENPNHVQQQSYGNHQVKHDLV